MLPPGAGWCRMLQTFEGRFCASWGSGGTGQREALAPTFEGEVGDAETGEAIMCGAVSSLRLECECPGRVSWEWECPS